MRFIADAAMMETILRVYNRNIIDTLFSTSLSGFFTDGSISVYSAGSPPARCDPGHGVCMARTSAYILFTMRQAGRQLHGQTEEDISAEETLWWL